MLSRLRDCWNGSTRTVRAGGSRRHLMSKLTRVAPAVACLLWPAVIQAADPPAVKEVAIDLAAHSFVQVLPFDVPFFITGQAPPRTRQIRVTIVDLKTGGAGPAVQFPWDAEQVSETQTPFRILMPRLDAERFYRFRFDFRRTLLKEEVDQIRTLATPRFEEVMRRLELQDGELSAADSAALRQRLSSTLEEMIGPSRQVIVEGTLFDPKTPHPDVLNQFNVASREVIAPQEDRAEVVDGYTARQAAVRVPLDAIRADAALDRVIAGIEASTDQSIITALGQWRSGIDLASLNDSQAAGRATGTQPVIPPPVPFASIWTVNDVTPFDRNYRRTLADLDALRQLLEASLPLLPSLAAADRAAVQALLAANGSLRAARNHVDALTNLTARLRADLDERTTALANLSRLVDVEAQRVVVVEGTTVADFRTAQNWYISMDAGFAYAFRIATMTPYVGANIYFRPVNKDAPLSLVDSFGRRFALTFGITLNSIEETTDAGVAVPAANKNRFDLLTNGRALLLGAGFRVTPSLRLCGGALVLKERDPNPLISRISVATVPYVSLSLDFDVASALTGGLGALFGGSENK